MRKFKRPAVFIYNYGSILSIILFVLGSIILARSIPNFSLTHYTISEIYLFSGERGQQILFYLFLTKFFLDLLFSISIFRKIPIKVISPASVLWFLPVVSFGALGFLPTGGQYAYAHLFLSIVMLFSWFFSEFIFSSLTANPYFYNFSKKLIFLQFVVLAAFTFSGHINGLFEIIYFVLSLIWLWTFMLVLDLR